MEEPKLELGIDPQAINRYIAERVLESALGERLRETVDEALKGLSRFGNDPLKSAVQSQVTRIVAEIVEQEHKPRIAAIVREQLTDEVISSIAAATVAKLMSGRDF